MPGLAPTPAACRFNLSTQGWVSDSPVEFRFFTNTSGVLVPLTDLSPLDHATVVLPMSVTDGNGQASVLALAKNAAGCEAMAALPVAVQLTPPTLASLSATFADAGSASVVVSTQGEC